MATGESSDYSTHLDELLLTGQQELQEEDGCPIKMESSLKLFHDLPSGKVDNGAQAVVTTSQETHDSLTPPGEQTTRTAEQVTTLSADRTLMLIPPKDSPLVLRHWVSEDSQCDNRISSAMEQVKTAIKEVVSAGRNLEECLEANNPQSQSQAIDCGREKDRCQQELKKYQERCATAGECERKLRESYEFEIARLEKEVTTLQLQKEEENTTHTCEIENLKQLHKDETEDLQYTIKLQAKHCRELDSDLEELRSRYAKKEQKVAKLRGKLEIQQRELAELGRAVKEKENEKEANKNIETKIKLQSMLLEKEELGEKLKTCEGISELVSRLPNLTSQEERDETTKQVIAKLRDISRVPSAKKARSWR